MIHEISQDILYKTNHRDIYASVESLNLKRPTVEKTGEKPCKFTDCIKCFNMCSIIGQNQRIHIGNKEQNDTEYEKGFHSKYKLMLK